MTFCDGIRQLKQAICQRRFSVIDMRDDTKVADMRLIHRVLFFLILKLLVTERLRKSPERFEGSISETLFRVYGSLNSLAEVQRGR